MQDNERKESSKNKIFELAILLEKLPRDRSEQPLIEAIKNEVKKLKFLEII